jgi:hypothetical protein
LAVSPAYAQDGFVYVYFATAADNRIARFPATRSPDSLVYSLGNRNVQSLARDSQGRLGRPPGGPASLRADLNVGHPGGLLSTATG